MLLLGIRLLLLLLLGVRLLLLLRLGVRLLLLLLGVIIPVSLRWCPGLDGRGRSIVSADRVHPMRGRTGVVIGWRRLSGVDAIG